MGRILIHIACDEGDLFDASKMIERLKDPKWSYSNLRQYLSLFTGDEVVWVDHLFQCMNEHGNTNMLLAWVILKDHSERLYCISVDEKIFNTEEKQ